MTNRIILGACIVLLAAGCTSRTIKKVNAVEAVQAEVELAESQRLDVSVAVFDPNVPEDEEEQVEEFIFPAVRSAESRYMPYVLRRTLEQTSQWGAVRVLPAPDAAAELLVTGRIDESDGADLRLRIRAVDATGREWLDRRYEDVAAEVMYREDINVPGDPFQDLYNRIANDLLAFRQTLSPEQLREIRQVSRLKYAAELSPEAFGRHLASDGDRVQIRRLPAQDDPMLARVDRIRESEYLFVDAVDQEYGVFTTRMGNSYDQWRRFSYEETLAREEVDRAARARAIAGAIALAGGMAASRSDSYITHNVGNIAAMGGLYMLKQAWDTSKQGKLHDETLHELAQSFDAEMKPITVAVEGEVIKLSGSLESQYAEWRRLLREIYAAETGFAPGSDSD